MKRRCSWSWFWVLASILFRYCAGTELSASLTVACPNDSLTFSCTVPGTAMEWVVVPPPGSPVSEVYNGIYFPRSFPVQPIGVEGFLFQAALVNDSNKNFTTTLTSITEVSQLGGAQVNCTSGMPLLTRSSTIIVADPPSTLLSPRVSSTMNGPSSSTVTVEWEPPSSPSGVSVSYVLTISPSPLSQSPLTVETTSAQITVSHNTQYNVTIRADNCAGSSGEELVTIPEIVACSLSLMPADRVTITDMPTGPLLGSVLTISCNDIRIRSICEDDGMWSPNPETYECQAIVSCNDPGNPQNGSIDVGDQSQPYPHDSTVAYYCDDGLFPTGVLTSTCTDVGGRGEWVPDPGTIVCRTSPAHCTLPPSPVNGSIVDYERLNRTVVEGTVLTYQCDGGLSLTGPTNITCANAGQWSTNPFTLTCVTPTTPPPVSGGADVGAIAGGVVGGVALIIILLATVTILIAWLEKRKKTDHKSSEEGIEMKEDLQAEYSELRHDGPKRGSKKTKATPADSDGYDKIAHSRQAQGPYDDIDVKNTSDGPEGYSTVNNGQSAQRLPGYGQLGNVATVEPVVYADLGVQPRKKRSDVPEVDQHTVTYATVDMAATEKMKASTMPASTKSAVSAEQADKFLNLDQALVQLRPVQSRWQEIAEALRVPETLIQQIADSYGKDPANAMTEVVDHWMRSCGRPTWRELADALNRIKEKGLAKQLMSVYETGRLPVELDMNKVPKEMYKYDDALPPPVPTRSPTITDTESPGLSRTLPPMRPPKYGGDAPPSRPPKPPPKDASPAPPRPPKPPRQ